MAKLLMNGGEEPERVVIRDHRQGPYVLIFALDGVGREQMQEALQFGSTPRISALFGAKKTNALFEHAYFVPNVVSILPSTTIAAWASIFTGRGPAHTGIPGNEWFVRNEMRFLAPIPASTDETDDARRAVADDLVGKELKVPTLFETLPGPAFVSLNYMHRGADLFTSDGPAELAAFAVAFKAGNLVDSPQLLQQSYKDLDRNSVPKVIDALRKYGVPSVQVVYFPGTDLFTHVAENPLHDQVHYLEDITFPLIKSVLDEYQRRGVMQETYVVFISDHGHTPVLMDGRHALAAESEQKAPGLLQWLGFRVRPSKLEISETQSDYQAVLAYQDAMAYVYLADRSTCPQSGQKCDWSKPPRFKQDVMPVVRAFYNANNGNNRFSGLKGTLDLIFARKPVPIGQETHEYEIYDGKRLIPINSYLKLHQRPDLIQLERRMHWLSAGPYGHLAGDVLLLAKSGLERPITERFYFSPPYHSQHGSASAQDGYISLIVAHQDVNGETIQKAVSTTIGKEPSQLDIVPLIRRLLTKRI